MAVKDSDAARIIAANIRYFLSQNDLTRVDLASKLGVSVATVGYWCAGQKIPRMDKVDAMCEIFHVTRSQLLLAPGSAAPSSLLPEQKALLDSYRLLSEDGKALLLARADELIRLGYTADVEAKKEDLASG